MSTMDDQRSDLLGSSSGYTPPAQATPRAETGMERAEGVGGDDWRESEEYQAFLAECLKDCRCTHSICDGVLAGGLCDEIIEDDRDEENYEHEDET